MSLADNAVGQGVGIAMGSPHGFQFGQFAMAGVTGGLSGLTAGLFTRGLFHQSGNDIGKLLCDTTFGSWMTRNVAGSMAGALVGDVLSQGYGYLTAADRSQWSWDWGQTFSSVAMAGATSAISAKMMWANMQRACFSPDVPVHFTRELSKPIITFRSYEEVGEACDRVITRDENDPHGPLVYRRVLRKFIRTAQLLQLQVGGRKIGTTAEHPIYVESKGWIAAGALQIGDVLRDFDGPTKCVEGIVETGRFETVVNLEIEDCHTYFVGSASWGFCVWAHNADCSSADINQALEEAGLGRSGGKAPGRLASIFNRNESTEIVSALRQLRPNATPEQIAKFLNKLNAVKALPDSRVYEIGLAKDLAKNATPFTEINHAPQIRKADTLLSNFDLKRGSPSEMAIRLPRTEHIAVSEAQKSLGAFTNARELMAAEARILRNNTEAPNSVIQNLVNRIQARRRWDFLKLDD